MTKALKYELMAAPICTIGEIRRAAHRAAVKPLICMAHPGHSLPPLTVGGQIHAGYRNVSDARSKCS